MDMVDENDLPDFEEIYNQYKQDLYYFALSILKNKQDAEDAVQETFMRIADEFTEFLQLSCNKQAAHSVIICRSISINIYNKNKLKAQRTASLDEEVTTTDVLDVCRSREDLILAMQKLPQDLKDVLYFRELLGYTPKETAKKLGISAGNVRIKAYRAKKLLRAYLKGENSND